MFGVEFGPTLPTLDLQYLLPYLVWGRLPDQNMDGGHEKINPSREEITIMGNLFTSITIIIFYTHLLIYK